MLQEFKSETEINKFFDEVKKTTLAAFSGGKKVEYQHISSVPTTK